MSYQYDHVKPQLLTDDGIEMILATLDAARKAHAAAGCFTLGKVLGGRRSGDTWVMLAAVDWLERAGRVKLLADTGSTEDRVYRLL